eukprot:CAMPEP_0184863644 /NCGR_PEP_ID=MMETSP0580-20130426/12021_1 /TAXON_ID=1118495 /ORGANISM="Dactyliosolen fragilissimus" /LENGTH=718 /DNA_ID=CAMNT_0027362095 /DNA_START=61 /DNA_END=2217 /DNA_ORIENTATION=+
MGLLTVAALTLLATVAASPEVSFVFPTIASSFTVRKAAYHHYNSLGAVAVAVDRNTNTQTHTNTKTQTHIKNNYRKRSNFALHQSVTSGDDDFVSTQTEEALLSMNADEWNGAAIENLNENDSSAENEDDLLLEVLELTKSFEEVQGIIRSNAQAYEESLHLLENEISLLKTQNGDMEKIDKEKQTIIDDLNASIKDYKDTTEDMMDRLENMSAKEASNEMAVKDRDEALARLEKTKLLYDDKVEIYVGNIKALKEQVADLNASILKLENMVNSRNLEVDKSKRDLEHAEAIKTQLEENMNRLQLEISSLKDELAEKNVIITRLKENQESLSSLELEINILKQTNEQLVESNKDKDNAISELSAAVDSFEAVSMDAIKEREDVKQAFELSKTSYKDKISDMDKAIETLKLELNDKHDSIAKLKSIVKTMTENADKRREQDESWEKQMASTKQMYNQNISKLEKDKTFLNEAISERDVVIKRMKEKQQVIAAHETKIKHLEDQNVALQKSNREKDKAIFDTSSTLEKYKLISQQTLTEKDKVMAKIETNKSAYEQKIKALNDSIYSLRYDVQEKNDAINKLKQTAMTVNRSPVDKKVTSNGVYEKQLDATKSFYDQKIAKLESDMRTMSQTLSSKDITISALEGERDKMKSEITQSKGDDDNAIVPKSMEFSHQNGNMDPTNNDSKLSETLKEKEKEINRLENLLSEALNLIEQTVNAL